MKARHTSRRLVTGVAVSSIVSLALSAVSVPAATPSEACSLLKQQEVVAAVGFDVAPGVKSSAAMCSWSEPGKEASGKNVAVSYLSEGVFQAGKTMRAALTRSESELGDEAYFILQTMGAPRLDVKKGNVYLRVQVRSVALGASVSSEEVQKEMAADRAIARIILQKF